MWFVLLYIQYPEQCFWRDDEDKIVANVECHYSQAKVDGHTFSLGDFAYIKVNHAYHEYGIF